MVREKNLLDTETLRVSTNPILEQYLEQLVYTGMYGKNATEAAERLIAEGIGRLLKDETLKKIEPPKTAK